MTDSHRTIIIDKKLAAAQNIKARDYWLNRLSGELPETHFPYDMPGGTRQRETTSLGFKLPPQQFPRLMKLSRGSDYTLYFILSAALAALLHCCTCTEADNGDIIFGTPIIKQENRKEFINTVLVLRSRLEDNQTFRELLFQMRKIILEAITHQDYPMEILGEQLGITSSGEEFSLFEIAILLTDIHDRNDLCPISLNLLFSFTRTSDGIDGVIEYNSALYRETTIKQISDRYIRLLGEAISHVDIEISGIDILTEEEKKQLLLEFNDTTTDYPRHRTIHELFEEQAEKTPGKMALVGNVSITYAELNRKSNRLAHLLREKGVLADNIVAIMMERSIEMIMGIMGILKAGAAYLPIDPDYPEERKQYILADSSAKLLVTTDNLEAPDFPLLPATGHRQPATSLAYVIYTSGTTGRPKGTLTDHYNVVRVVKSTNYIEITPEDRVLQLSNFAFDGSVFDIFGALLNGAALALTQKEDTMDIRRLADILKGEAITVFFLTTALFNTLVDMEVEALPNVRKVLFGGEQVSVRHVRKALAVLGKGRIVHVYGPTETTVYATFHPVDAVDEEIATIPIGNPISNTSIYILDRRMRPVPIGITGEIYIGGEGVARGYLNCPELTAEKFYYRSYRAYRTYRSYKTGDLGKWLESGDIVFMGRVDQQVKIRGFRIEPGEIERLLMNHGDIKETAVIVRPHADGDRYLCAYVVWKTEGRIAALKDYLSNLLPGYMVPEHIIPLEKMPLNRSGKVDWNVLPQPPAAAGEKYTPPRNAVEEKLVRIWSEVLGLQTAIGIDDNFFERGGHSLKAAILVSLIRKEFNVEFSLSRVFIEASIRAMGEYIAGAEKSIYDEICPVEKQEYYPQSSAQKRLFLLDRFENVGIGYNMPMILKLEGNVDVERYERAFERLVSRHESLRTSFHWINDRPVQRISEENYKFRITNYKQITNSELQITKIIKDFIRPFDLAQSPLLRAGVVKLSKEESLLLLDMHHIVSDGTSLGILADDFIRFNTGENPVPLTVQYKDFSRWQNRLFETGKIKEQENYWLSVYPDPSDIPRLNLPVDFSRPLVYRFDGDRYGFTLSPGDTAAFKRLTGVYQEKNPADRGAGVTLFMNLLAAFTALLYRYAGQDDIVVGTGTAGRPHADLQGIIGMFVNSLALRSHPRADLPYMEFLTQVRDTSLKAFENQDYQFELLVERLNPTRDPSRNPLFDVSLMVQNFGAPQKQMKDVTVSPYGDRIPISKFDITLMAHEIGDTIYFNMEYCTALFKKETIRQMAAHFLNTLRCVSRNPYVPLADIEIMTEEEKQHVLSGFNFTSSDISYPLDRTIHRLFEEQAARTPDGVSVVGSWQLAIGKKEKMQITYRVLKEKAGQLACLLREKGVLADDIIGIMVERSIEMIIGIIGILKVGGAYLPIDAKYPEERKQYMLADSGARILLKKSEIRIPTFETNPNDRNSNDQNKIAPCIVLNFEHLNFEFVSDFGFRASNFRPLGLAYVLYTSGSTGRPRGVMVEHRNVVNLVWGLQERIYSQYPRCLNVALVASVLFDASVQQIFAALLQGHCLHIVPEAVKADSGKLPEFYHKYKIDITDGTPAHLRMLTAGLKEGLQPPTLKHLLIGGEALPAALAIEFLNLYEKSGVPIPRIANVYGPTECCVDSTSFEISNDVVSGMDDTVPIGNPMPNEQVFIVFPANPYRLQPVGAAGELCIAGLGVGRGYLNNPELTAEKFEPQITQITQIKKENITRSFGKSRNPFSKGFLAAGGILYKTGDLARWLPDGTIEFLGRMDRQVKIRGYRIELAEIENRLLKHKDIKEAVVIDRESKEGERSLCAYLVMEKAFEKKPDGAALKEYLSHTLPGYMMPAHFVVLDSIPLTPNSKVNRKTLPLPEMRTSKSYEPPGNKIEEKLAEIWSEVLGSRALIGIDDNFFALGGHSLNASLMVLKIHKVFRVKIPLEEVFRVPTIRELAVLVKDAGTVDFLSIPPAPQQEYYPVSSAQKRLYILQQMDTNQIVYNLPQAVWLEGSLDKQQLETAFKKMIKRHESLRTSFYMKDNEPVQKIHAPDDFPFDIEYHNLAPEDTEVTEDIGQVPGNLPTANCQLPTISDFIRPFDLSKAPLLRVGLIHTPALAGHPSQEGITGDKHILMLDMHHIISDGVSGDIFVNEMIALYHGIGLPEVPLQYKDFSCWQNQMIRNGQMAQQETYWLEVFSKEEFPPFLNLPLDYPRPAVRRFEGSHLAFEIGPQETAALNRLAVENNATLYMVLLAGYTIFLSKLTGQEDIVVGSPIAGRRHADLQSTIGMFVNTLAIRNFPKWDLAFKDYLEEVRNRTLNAYENQDYPFEDLVERVVEHRDTSRNPLVDVIFALQHMTSDIPPIPGTRKTRLSVRPYPYENRTSKFDLVFLGTDMGMFIIEYSTALFKNETVQRFIRYFRTILEAVIENPGRKIGDIDMLPREERQQLLEMLDNTAFGYPTEKTIHQMFEEQAARTPDGVSVVGSWQLAIGKKEKMQITCSVLKEKAGRLAEVLREKGVLADNIVGILMEPSVELIIGILGILKAGGAYLPIDPEYPEERKQYILADSGARILLTNLSEGHHFHHSSNRFITHHPGSLAYVIYTSGSTGKPKGSAVQHRNVVRLFFNDAPLFDFSSRDIWTLFHSVSFDFSVWEMYGALLFGGRLVVFPRTAARDIRGFFEILCRECVTVLNQTPSSFYALMAAACSKRESKLNLRYVIFGGEALSPGKLKPWREKYPHVKLINMYGITETTVHVTYKEITEKEIEKEISNIGKPIPTLGIGVLDKNLQMVSPGVAGEICVYGDGLCRGYLNHPELNYEKLLRGVQGGGFLEKSPPGRRRLYKTGDLGRVLENGDLEHLGRIDRQVKIRGFRIELGEIENRLLEHENIKEAVVAARESEGESGQRYLCAYIVPGDAAAFARIPPDDELRRYLSRTLPGYMIPAHFVVLDRIPLTANGKVDRKNLPAFSFQPSAHYAVPANELEERLIEIWSEVLGPDRKVLPGSHIGVEDNFFDLGGNSLDIVNVSNKIKETLNLDIPVIKLFEYPTVRSLVRHIRGTGEQRVETAALHKPRPVEIAVIGMAGRYPGAGNIDEFWENLKNGVESITFYTDDELEAAGLAPDLIENPNFVKSDGGLLEDKECFDAAFFDYTPQQAEVMSPQMRLLHETAWEALEHAGYVPDTCDFPTGLFAGASSSFYWEALSLLSGKINMLGQFASSLLVNKDHAVTNVSYKLNLKGPALLVQTACSTSLAAIDLAVHAILEGRCRMALAGGVTVNLSPSKGYLYQEGMVQSPDGHCRAFDAEAGGLAGGEGAGIVVLKHLQDALTDGDTIYAVIKGTAVNNDGSRKVGFTAPSIQGQAEVIRSAMEMAKVPVESITYVETHGTGTILGDPVEIQGLIKAFNTGRKGFCRIGSVKTNIGHLDAAAGAAGFIKTVLALKHRQVPPSLHFKTPNPAIDFENSPFVVNTELIPWKSDGYPLRAGVSSFGIGGTNVHVILEEAPVIGRTDSLPVTGETGKEREYRLLVLSARTSSALDKMTENLVSHLKRNDDINLRDAAYTLHVGRKAFNHRRMMVCSDVDEAIETLENKQSGSIRSAVVVSEKELALVFMFTGLGSQYVNMGRDLYEKEPEFRKTMDRCFEIIRPLMEYDIKEFLYPSSVSSVTSVTRSLDRTEITQPVIFIFEYALAKLLMSWGIRPDAMIGYSFGEYAAAAVAGVFSLEDALKLVVYRSQLIRELGEGAMLSVPLSRGKLLPLVKGKENLSLAVDNGESCIVSGPEAAVTAFERQMKEQKCLCLRVSGDRAIHSSMMDPMLETFEQEVARLTLNSPEIPYISNVTGDWITLEQVVDPHYWVWHLRRTVQFDAGIRKLVTGPGSLFVEIGPGRDISTLAARYMEEDHSGRNTQTRERLFNLVRHPLEKVTDDRYLLTQVGRLWLKGVTIDWKAFYNRQKLQHIPLPTYPFERERFWDPVDAFSAGRLRLNMGSVSDAPGTGFVDKSRRPMAGWFYTPAWEQAPLPNIDRHEIAGHAPLCWLIFTDDCGIGQRIRLVLESINPQNRVVAVEKGSKFERLEVGRYILDPGQPGHYDSLFRHLHQGRQVPQGIIHLWGLGYRVGNREKPVMDTFNDALDVGLYSLLNMVRAMGRENITTPLQLTAVTNNMQEVMGGELLCPEKAAVLGAMKSIPLEYPHIRCRSIDILLPGPGTPQEDRLLAHLLREFQEVFRDEVEIIAFRGHYRWKQTFRPLQLERSMPAENRLRNNGVYLITGGFGGMGFALAQDLAGNFSAKLVLVGRSPFPARQEWNRWLETHGEEHDISRKIGKIREMEEGGAEVMTARADVSDLAEMRGVVQEAEARFGPVNGIIHTAGKIDYGGIIQRRTKEMTEAVLAPKVGGLAALETLFKPEQLDFFMIFSSIASVLTPFGQVGYVAANAFLDAYAYSKSQYNGKYMVINWSDWLEAGMAVKAITRANEGNPERIRSELEALIPIALTPSEGIEAFHRILAHGHPRIMVCIQEMEAMKRFHNRYNTNRGGVTTSTLHRRPELGTEYQPPTNDFEKTVAGILQRYLAIDQVGIDDNFFELGLSSLDIIQVNVKLKEVLKKEIPLVTMFTYPTIRHFSRYVNMKAQEEAYRDQAPGETDQAGELLHQSINLLTGWPEA